MNKLPDNLSEEDFLKVAELLQKYEESKLVVRCHKMINSSVEIVVPLIENMKQKEKELNDFTKTDESSSESNK